jgi:hypothetical protein
LSKATRHCVWQLPAATGEELKLKVAVNASANVAAKIPIFFFIFLNFLSIVLLHEKHF